MFIISTILNLIRKTFAVIGLLILAANRWVAFIAHLIMMFFIWNSLLVVIGFVSTIQMVIGFGFDMLKITTATNETTVITDNSTIGNTREKMDGEEEGNQHRGGLNEYWQGRRKVFQEFVDSLYVKYMHSIVEASNPPNGHQYWQWQQSPQCFYQQKYIFPQPPHLHPSI
ncbi:14957_t:CDS:2 [Entrophospora sp. SA101]|nr:14957_t:CDS:2 [Entrophospora sp. SA101]